MLSIPDFKLFQSFANIPLATNNYFNKFIYIIVFLFLLIIFTRKKIQSQNSFSFSNTLQLRGIAILLVIICHFSVHLLWIIDANNIFASMGKYGVGIFLLLSGFGLTISYLNRGIYKRWLLAKYLRIWFPYIIVTSIFYLLDFLLLHINHTKFEIASTLLGVIIPYNTNMVDFNMWYITYILFEYVFFYFIFKIKFLNNFQKLLFITLITPLFAIFHDYFLLHSYHNPFSTWSNFYLTAFPIGIAIALLQKTFIDASDKVKQETILYLLAFMTLVSFFESYLLQQNNLWGSLFFVFGFLFFAKLGCASRFLAFI